MWHPEKKFVFVHPQKCAGTSVREILREKFPDGKEPKGSGHWSVTQWNEHIKNETQEDISDYFVFGVIRNPWDRAVSYYHHFRKHRKYKHPFWRFVMNTNHLSTINYNIFSKFTIKNKNMVDYVMRQECIESDFEELAERLNFTDYTLEKITHNTERNGTKYQTYFDSDDLIRQVAAMSQFEIYYYGYKFEYE